MASPLLPVDLLRIPVFALSIATSICSFCAQMLAGVAIPFYLQNRYGYSAVEIGLLITPWPITVAIAAPLAGRLVERYPAGLLGGIGLVLFAPGSAASPALPAHPTHVDVAWRMALSGLGFGLFQSPNNRTCSPRRRASARGGASGMLGTARLLGPDHRCCAGGAVPRPLSNRRHAGLAVGGGRLRAVRRHAQHAAPV